MRRFFEPVSAPPWLKAVLTSIKQALGDIWDTPIRPFQAATADLPAAADFAGGLAYNLTSLVINWSDGSSWKAPYVSGAALTGVPSIAILTTGTIKLGTETTQSTDATFISAKTVDNGTAGNGHAFSDSAVITRSGTIGYNSFDAVVTYSGSNNYDHFAGFQARPIFNSSGTITNIYGGFTVPAIQAGTVTNYYGGYVANPTGAGALTNAYGYYVEALSKASGSRFAFYQAGSGDTNHFAGPIEGASLTLTTALGAASGGTGNSSYAVGDILYASGATTLSKLADVATGNALISGGVTTAPSWGKIGLTTHVSGTLAAGNGGTGSTFTQFSGPATSVKTFTLPNATDTIACLGQVQTWTAAQTFVATTITAAGAYLTLNSTAGTGDSEIILTRSGTSLWAIGTSSGASNENYGIYNYTRGGIDFSLNKTTGMAVVGVGLELPSYTVANLPTANDGTLAFASNGRKTGEGVGAGTGVPVYRDGGTWFRFADDSAVAA